MSTRITDIKANELSLIFGEHKGEQWSPVNGDARMLSVKGSPTAMGRFVDRLKGYFTANSGAGWPVSTDVADDIDGDGDGAADYNQLCTAFSSAYWDLSSAYGISDDSARSLAIKCVFDEFLSQLDSFRSTKKAGKRNSAADQAHIDAIAEAHKKMTDAANTMTDANAVVKEHLEALGGNDKPDADDADDATQKAALEAFVVGDVAEDGLPTNFADYSALCEKAKKKDDDPYGDVEYADPGYQEDGKKRYPLDTEEHVKAAASYFGMEKNRSKYTDDQQKKIDAKIAAAEKKFGIGDSKKGDVIAGAPASIATDAVKAMIADALSEAQASFKAQLDEIRTTTDASVAAAKSEVETAKALAKSLQETNTALIATARTPSASSPATNVGENGNRVDASGQAVKVEVSVKGRSVIDGAMAILAANRA